jgi:hypothetical protein
MARPEKFDPGTDAESKHLLQLLYWFRGESGKGLHALMRNTSADEYIFDLENLRQPYNCVRMWADGRTLFQADGNGVKVRPKATGEAAEVVDVSTAQTLANKTLQSPIFTGREIDAVGSTITILAAAPTIIPLAAATTQGNLHLVVLGAGLSSASITQITSNGIAAQTWFELRFNATGITIRNTGNIKLNNGDFVSGVNAILRLRWDGTDWIEIGRVGSLSVNSYARLSNYAALTINSNTARGEFGTETEIFWRKNGTHDRDTGSYLSANENIATVTAPSTGRYLVGVIAALQTIGANSNLQMRVKIKLVATSGSDTLILEEIVQLRTPNDVGDLVKLPFSALVTIADSARQSFRVLISVSNEEDANQRGFTLANGANNTHFWITRDGDV